MGSCTNVAFVRLTMLCGLLALICGCAAALAKQAPVDSVAVPSVATTERLVPAAAIETTPVEAASPSDLATPALDNHLPSPTDAAAEALAKIGTPAVPRVLLLLQDPNPRVRQRGAEILAKMGPPAKRGVNELIYLLHDHDPAVRVAAAGALGSIGSDAANAIPVLIEQVAHQP